MVKLVPSHRSYAPFYFQWRQQSSVLRYNPLVPRTEEELREVMESLSSDLSDTEAPAYLWFIESDGQLVGTVSLKEISRSQQYGEIGYTMTEEHQRKGIATSAVRLMIDRIFAESDLYRLQAVIAEDNLPSRRLVTKLGFTQEGLLREHYIVGGRRVNEVLYGLLRPEWYLPPHHANP